MFTPPEWVDRVLDLTGYQGEDMRVMDNSCGDGAFLRAVAERICAKHSSLGKESLGELLARCIHGIEIDPVAHAACLANLDGVAAKHGVRGVQWDVSLGDALRDENHAGAMDVVVGNPPYIFIHDLGERLQVVRDYGFCGSGMTDLYLAFVELGFRMLAPDGVMGLLTPSSWLTSKAGRRMRDFVRRESALAKVLDMGHHRVFDKITAYPIASVFRRGNADVEVLAWDGTGAVPMGRVALSDIDVAGRFLLGPPRDLRMARAVLEGRHPKACIVRNGFCTGSDAMFIDAVDFTELTIPVLKASTGKWGRAFYPYDGEGKPLTEGDVFSRPAVAAYLSGMREAMRPREGAWWLYSKTQAIHDVWRDKVAVNVIVRDPGSVRVERVPAGCGLYSGLYVLTEAPFAEVERSLRSERFVSFVRTLGRRKSGGYWTFGASDLEAWLNADFSGVASSVESAAWMGGR